MDGWALTTIWFLKGVIFSFKPFIVKHLDVALPSRYKGPNEVEQRPPGHTKKCKTNKIPGHQQVQRQHQPTSTSTNINTTPNILWVLRNMVAWFCDPWYDLVWPLSLLKKKTWPYVSFAGSQEQIMSFKEIKDMQAVTLKREYIKAVFHGWINDNNKQRKGWLNQIRVPTQICDLSDTSIYTNMHIQWYKYYMVISYYSICIVSTYIHKIYL